MCSLNLDLCNNAGESALWLALNDLDSAYLTSDDITKYDSSFPSKLITRGANCDALDPRTGNSLLHHAALECREAAAVFLVHHGAQLNPKNGQGEAAIHIAARNGLHTLVEVLLQHGADANQQTALKPSPASPVPSAAAAMPLSPVHEYGPKRSESPRPIPPTSLPPPPPPSSLPSSHNTPSTHSPSPSPHMAFGGGGGGDMMDFDLTSSAMSSAALGALSALSATSQALSGTQVSFLLYCTSAVDVCSNGN